MFNLSRLATLGGVARSFGATRKVFASTKVLADNHDAADTQKLSKPKSENNIFVLKTQNRRRILADPTVAAIFKSLNDPDDAPVNAPAQNLGGDKQSDLDEIILNAKTVNGLLGIAETRPDIGRTHALKVRDRYHKGLDATFFPILDCFHPRRVEFHQQSKTERV